MYLHFTHDRPLGLEYMMTSMNFYDFYELFTTFTHFLNFLNLSALLLDRRRYQLF